MSSRLLIGLGSRMIPVPRVLWQWQIRKRAGALFAFPQRSKMVRDMRGV